MPNKIALALCICFLWSCGSSTSGSGGTASGPGALVDNTLWVPTAVGDDILGPRPEDAECALMPIDCPQFPWPEGECVVFDPVSTCVASFIPECLDSFTVLAVNTRMPDNRLTLCNWITLEQPSLRTIRAGDQVEVRARHDALTAPATVPPTQARMIFVIGDEMALDYSTSIPSDSTFETATWTATKDYPAGTPLLWHVDNHGSNEYQLIEVNIR